MITLRKYKEAKYFESVGGVYLGMDKKDLLKLYGKPSRKTELDTIYGKQDNEFIYEQEGFIARFSPGANDIVTSIIIFKTSDKKLDWSGLPVNSSKDNFIHKYNISNAEKYKYLPIGYGEVICVLYNDKIVLYLDNLPSYI